MTLGWKVTVGAYHLARAVAPPRLRDEGALIIVGGPTAQRVDPET